MERSTDTVTKQLFSSKIAGVPVIFGPLEVMEAFNAIDPV
jgi:hypothetical protein